MGETGADFKWGAQGKLAFFPPFYGLVGSVCMLPLQLCVIGIVI